uniref:Uncharacterized protein n=1 Tax=Meloidogyne javanica TaxID=6303 RepID=A0A915LXT8_MELJA
MQNGFSDDLNELEISSVNVEPLNNREKLGRPVYKNLCPDFKERTACLHRDLISDWISLLLAENRERVENVDDTFKCFVNPKSVEYLFTVCLRLQLPPDVKYIALEIYNKFMTLHTTSLYEAINSQKSLSVMQKEEKWEQIFTTVSRQVALRILSSVQIASKLHSYSMGLTIDRVRYCLQLLGYAYTEQSIRKSEVRVLMAIGWCANVMQTPVTYIETFLHTIYRLNCHLEMNTRALWDYSLLIMDCIFLHSEEFYQRVAIVAHGNNAQYVPMKRLGRIEADYVLLASGVIVAACICVHGEDFVGTVLITLQRTTERAPSRNIMQNTENSVANNDDEIQILSHNQTIFENSVATETSPTNQPALNEIRKKFPFFRTCQSFNHLENLRRSEGLLIDKQFNVVNGIPEVVYYRCKINLQCPFTLQAVYNNKTGFFELYAPLNNNHFHSSSRDPNSSSNNVSVNGNLQQNFTMEGIMPCSSNIPNGDSIKLKRRLINVNLSEWNYIGEYENEEAFEILRVQRKVSPLRERGKQFLTLRQQTLKCYFRKPEKGKCRYRMLVFREWDGQPAQVYEKECGPHKEGLSVEECRNGCFSDHSEQWIKGDKLQFIRAMRTRIHEFMEQKNL